MKTRFVNFGVIAAAVFALNVSVRDANAGDYYQGKTIRFIVGFAAGGGYDAFEPSMMWSNQETSSSSAAPEPALPLTICRNS